MTLTDIASLRLHHQSIANARFTHPAEVVAWLGAVQAQDYLGALWGVGLRMQKATENEIEKALADRTIVRTWPMRGTLHLVAAADIRWMLKLLTPRIVDRVAQRNYQQLGLDKAAFTRSQKLLAKALEGGKQLRRDAVYEVLEAGGIATADGRGLHIVSRLSQDGFLCFGPRAGKQQTFTLLEEWVPTAKSLAREEALAELALRYFTSHGPATLQDFAWWTGLPATEARTALELVKSQLIQEDIAGQTYWFAASLHTPKDKSPTAYLLPAYDEYTVAYKDRRAVLNPSYAKQENYGHGIFNPTIVVDGQVVGTWKRTIKKTALSLVPSLFTKLNQAETQALAAAANRYGAFLGAALFKVQNAEARTQ